jgi:hypothetical protein
MGWSAELKREPGETDREHHPEHQNARDREGRVLIIRPADATSGTAHATAAAAHSHGKATKIAFG